MGAIKGIVRNTTGLPLEGATVMFIGKSPSHKDIAALTDDAGSYSFKDLSPGSYTLLARAEQYEPKSSDAEVPAGDSARLDFILRPT